MLFDVVAPLGGSVAGGDDLVERHEARLDPELSHFVFGRGELEEGAAGV